MPLLILQVLFSFSLLEQSNHLQPQSLFGGETLSDGNESGDRFFKDLA